jgi:hypothetical protein
MVPNVCRAQLQSFVLEQVGDCRVARSNANSWSNRDIGFHAYDSWRGTEEGGITSFTGRMRVGGAEFGDDINLVGGYPSLVSDWGFSIWNSSSTQSLTDLEVTVRLYTADRGLLGFEHWYQSGGFVPPNGRALFFTSGGSILRDNIPTREHMFMTIQFSNTLNYDISQIGVLWGGPVTTGSSSSNIYNFTTGQVIDLGGNGDRNLGFFVDTIEAPAPGALLAAAIAAPLALRRRRTA